MSCPRSAPGWMGLLALMLSSPLHAAPTRLLTELEGADVVVRDSRPSDFVAHGDRVLFAATRSDVGRALFMSDGTEAGTSLLHELAPGRLDARFTPLETLGDELFFWAKTPSHGWELWATDATLPGTRLVVDLLPGPDSASRDLLRFGDGFLLGAATPALGSELFLTDGTEAGTELVLDIIPGPLGSGAGYFAALGDLVLFGAVHPSLGYELWRTDGTAAGTELVKDLNPGPDGGLWDCILVAGDVAYLEADEPDTGRELWRSDGTEAGTFLLRDTAPGPDDASLSEAATAFGDLLLFATSSGGSDRLWRSDGTTAGTLVLAEFDVSAKGLGWITVVGDQAFFSVQNFASRGLWVTDGTAAGTRPVSPSRPGWPAVRAWDERVAHDDGLLYFAQGYLGEQQLWATDGTEAGTRLIAELASGGSETNIRELTSVAGSLWFQGCTETSGCEPWISDGTSGGTRLVVDLQASLSAPVGLERPVEAAGRSHLVEPRALPSANRVWSTDGTASGTSELGESGDWVVEPGHLDGDSLYLWKAPSAPLHLSSSQGLELVSFRGPRSLAVLGDTVLFSTGGAPQRYRPADGVTTPLAPFEAASNFVAVGARAFFNGTSSSGESGLWTWSPAGETRVGDWTLDGPMAPMGDRLVFVQDWQVWITDGTAAGTQELGGPPTWGGSEVVATDERVYFTVRRSSDSGTAVWTSDGSPDSAELLFDVNPGGLDADPEELNLAGRRLYFTASDGVSGRELWTSDGTETRRVADLNPGPFGSNPDHLAPIPGTSWLLFSAWTPETGSELWLTDGTEAGTRLVHDFATGPRSSGPSATHVVGGQVVVGADPDGSGQDLWAVTVGPGAVPAGDAGGSTAMRVRREADRVQLDWSESCGGAVDFVVYEGPLEAPFDAHAPVACSTGGALRHETAALPGSRYYLVSGHDGAMEGPAGWNSHGQIRRAADHCLPELPLGCPP